MGNGPVVCLQFAPDGKSLATGSTDYSAKVWNYRKGSQMLHLELDGYQEPVTTLCFHPDGSTLACAMQDRTIKFLETFTERSNIRSQSRVWPTASIKLNLFQRLK